MMAYIAHNMDDSKDFRTRLETIKSDVVAARKLVEEGVGLLRMAEEEKEAAQAEARWLAEENEAIMAGNNKTDEEARRLRQELWAGFAI